MMSVSAIFQLLEIATSRSCRSESYELLSSALARESHACQDASHIREAGDHARHRIVGMNLILQIDVALVLSCDERFKHLPRWHDAVSHRDLALFALEVREVLNVHIEQPRAFP